MTRQLIICSALIASVTGPALAATNMGSNLAGSIRITNPAVTTRATNLAGNTRVNNPAGLFKASNPAEWLRPHLPVDFVHRASNPASQFSVKRADEMIHAGSIGPPITLDRPTNPVAGRLEGFRIVCRSAAAGRFLLGTGRSACERINDPPLFAHQANGDRAGLGARRVIVRRPYPGPIYIHLGSTLWATGANDNQ